MFCGKLTDVRLKKTAILTELVTGEQIAFDRGAEFNSDFYSVHKQKHIFIARSGKGGVFELTTDEVKDLFE